MRRSQAGEVLFKPKIMGEAEIVAVCDWAALHLGVPQIWLFGCLSDLEQSLSDAHLTKLCMSLWGASAALLG